MAELVVVPQALVGAAGALEDTAARLDAVSAALPAVSGEVGPLEVAMALEDLAHVWQPALRALADALGQAGRALVSAATSYDAVEGLVGDWSGG